LASILIGTPLPTEALVTWCELISAYNTVCVSGSVEMPIFSPATVGAEFGYSGMLNVPILSATSAEQRTIAVLEGI